jgi:replicative DNA helicase
VSRLPPHDLEAEKAVLGGVLLRPALFEEVADVVTGSDWYSQQHAVVWQAMTDLHAAQAPIDGLTLRARLVATGRLRDAGGDEGLLEIGNVFTAVNIEHHAALIAKLARARAMIDAAHQIVADGYAALPQELDEYIDNATQRVFAIADSGHRRETAAPLGQVMGEVYNDIKVRADRGFKMAGLSSGFHQLDAITSGFEPGDLWILAGRPSMGKSAVATRIAVHVAREFGHVALFSMEMHRLALGRRIMSTEGKYPHANLRNGNIARGDWSAITKLNNELVKVPLTIDDASGLRPVQIRGRARRLTRKYGPLKMVVIDYLTIMRPDQTHDGRRDLDVNDMCQSIKDFAKDMNIPVLLLAQLNRSVEGRAGKKQPQLSDLRESGGIEQIADGVVFVHRPEVYDKENHDLVGQAELIVAKQRNGATGTAHLRFVGDFARFENEDDQDPGHDWPPDDAYEAAE